MSTETTKKKSIKNRIIDALKEEKKPMSLEAIYKVIADKPKPTVRGVLNINSGEGKVFFRPSKGMYALAEQKDETQQAPKVEPAATPEPPKAEEATAPPKEEKKPEEKKPEEKTTPANTKGKTVAVRKPAAKAPASGNGKARKARTSKPKATAPAKK